VDDHERRVARIFAPVLTWLGFVLIVDRGRWQHSVWNLASDFVLLTVVVPGLAALQRATEGEAYRRLANRWRSQWPTYFWATYFMTGVAMLAPGYTGVGIAILVVPAVVFAWAGLKKLTADPWK
jgi:hypothetical protein